MLLFGDWKEQMGHLTIDYKMYIIDYKMYIIDYKMYTEISCVR